MRIYSIHYPKSLSQNYAVQWFSSLAAAKTERNNVFKHKETIILRRKDILIQEHNITPTKAGFLEFLNLKVQEMNVITKEVIEEPNQ